MMSETLSMCRSTPALNFRSERTWASRFIFAVRFATRMEISPMKTLAFK